MRCLACDKLLTDFEATRKSAETKQYIDLCNYCYQGVSKDIVSEEREDLRNNDEFYEGD